jgi:Flp pilus assembly pilin Flp
MIDRIVVWALSLKARPKGERGQDVMEYAIITGGVAIALVAALVLLRPEIENWFQSMADWFATNLIP